jgi:hypothetical protein
MAKAYIVYYDPYGDGSQEALGAFLTVADAKLAVQVAVQNRLGAGPDDASPDRYCYYELLLGKLRHASRTIPVKS